ncbi:MAG: tetratricopeptide repeat protein, partial [Candidatus Heimdallarchaeota archaeon]|nr:tetratricopeptide repeat protein [Candidatus Heimdallarchaeota archaeon]
REMNDVFIIQDEISLAIVENLKLVLMEGEETKILKRYTNDAEAYNFYLKGRFFYNKRLEGDMKSSVEYFERALEKDPKFGLAYAGLAAVYTTLALYHLLPYEEARTKAKKNALKGLEVDESIGETHAAYALYLQYFQWHLDEAEKEYKEAILLSPSDVQARHMYAHLLEFTGRFDKSTEEMKIALDLEPLSINLNVCMGTSLFLAGDYVGAIDQFRMTIEMDSNFPLQYFWLGRSLIQTGQLQEAIEIFKKGSEFPTIKAMSLGGLGLAYALEGRETDALKVIDQLVDLSTERYVETTSFAYIYMGLIDIENTFAYLEKGFEIGDWYLFYLPIDPIFKDLTSDPRYKALTKKMGLENILGSKHN